MSIWVNKVNKRLAIIFCILHLPLLYNIIFGREREKRTGGNKKSKNSTSLV